MLRTWPLLCCAILLCSCISESRRCGRTDCCVVCTQGKACGNACIASNLNCQQGEGCACSPSEAEPCPEPEQTAAEDAEDLDADPGLYFKVGNDFRLCASAGATDTQMLTIRADDREYAVSFGIDGCPDVTLFLCRRGATEEDLETPECSSSGGPVAIPQREERDLFARFAPRAEFDYTTLPQPCGTVRVTALDIELERDLYLCE